MGPREDKVSPLKGAAVPIRLPTANEGNTRESGSAPGRSSLGTMQGLISELALTHSGSLDGWQGSSGACLCEAGVCHTATAPGASVLTADPTRVALDPFFMSR